MTAPLSLTFVLRVKPRGKERPRVTAHGTFMPKAYKAWQQIVRWQVRSQIPAHILPLLPLTGRLAWHCFYSVPHGEMGPDGDNADGSLWDAIQVPPTRRDKKTGQLRGGGWGLIANDKQFKRWGGEIVAGPTCITFTVSEIP
jgi:Holliday junction resolvase RusA-like endonuclease